MDGPLTLILAEDDDGHASLVRRNLQRAGFAHPIVRVCDGQELLDYIGAQGASADRPAGDWIVLLDIKMPRVDGVEALRRLKDDGRTAKIPVIILTTTDDPREVERCYEFGCNAYITKPVEYEALVEAVNSLGPLLKVVQVPRNGPRSQGGGDV
jgi:CheY-like chemotaxis protein